MSCPICGNINIPVGPIGPAGRNGITMIGNQIVAASTPADILSHVLQTITVPANTLVNNGDKLLITAMYYFPNAHAKTIALQLPNFNCTPVAGINSLMIVAEMNRIDATHYVALYTSYNGGDVFPPNPGTYTSPELTNFTLPIVINAVGQNGVASAGDIICYKLEIDYYSIL